MSEVIAFPTPESALQVIIQFAAENNLTPEQLVKLMIDGAASHEGLVVMPEDRIAGLRLNVILNKGPKPETLDWESVSERIGWGN